MAKNTYLYFRDLVMLRVIAENSDSNYGVVYQNMTKLGNHWLTKYNVTLQYAKPFGAGLSQHQVRMEKLLNAGLVKRVGQRKGFMASDRGIELLETIGNIWKEWPIAIPISGGDDILIEDAVYAQQLRESL